MMHAVQNPIAPKWVSPKKLTSAEKAEEAQADKPEPYGRPGIWASKRQALCEALPDHYQAYQSAAYHTGGIVKGFLLDGEPGIRDVFDNEIIITRVYVLNPLTISVSNRI